MKYLILLLIIVVAVKLFRKPESVAKAEAEPKALDTVQDPIDGTFVSKDTEYKVKYYDKVYYFGSKANMEKFVAMKKGEQS